MTLSLGPLIRLLGRLVIIVFVVLPSSAYASKIWYSQTLIELTGGYDPGANRTFINKVYLVARGPDSVVEAVQGSVMSCLQEGLAAGAAGFKASPSPEFSIRIAAGYTAFHSYLLQCFTKKQATKLLVGQFEIGLLESGIWVPGARLRFTADHPHRQMYEQFHNEIKDKLPDPLNKLINVYVGLQAPQISLDLKVDPPEWLTKAIADMPTVKELNRYAEEAKKLLPKDVTLSTLSQENVKAFIKASIEQSLKKQLSNISEEEARRALRNISKEFQVGIKQVSVEVSKTAQLPVAALQELYRAIGLQAEAVARELRNVSRETEKLLDDTRAAAAKAGKQIGEESIKAVRTAADATRKAADQLERSGKHLYQNAVTLANQGIKDLGVNKQVESISQSLAGGMKEAEKAARDAIQIARGIGNAPKALEDLAKRVEDQLPKVSASAGGVTAQASPGGMSLKSGDVQVKVKPGSAEVKVGRTRVCVPWC